MNAGPTARAEHVRELIVNGSDGPLEARLYTAFPRKRDMLIVFFHGGGFVRRDLDEHDGLLRLIADSLAKPVVLAPHYTLATRKPFPAAAEDAYSAVAWSQKNKAKLGWTGKRLIVAGIEAGGNLAAVCCSMALDRCGPDIAGQILFMPMLDPGLSSCSMRSIEHGNENAYRADIYAGNYRAYIPDATDRGHPYACPAQSSRLRRLPPALFFSVASHPLSAEAEQYATRLRACGVHVTSVHTTTARFEKYFELDAAKTMASRPLRRFLSILAEG